MTSPVVFLHGFLGCAEDFADVVAALPAHRCVALTLPGHGPSPVPLHATDFAGGLAQVRAQVDAIGGAPFHLVGYSMGGRLALALAARHPEIVASVTAIGASAGVADDQARAKRYAADLALADRLVRDDFDAFLRAWYDQELFTSLRQSDAFANVLVRRRGGQPAQLARALSTFGVGGQPPLHDELRRGAVPAQLIAGARDHMYASQNAQLAAGWRRARCHIVPGAGHSVHLESPMALARALASFLQDRDRDS